MYGMLYATRHPDRTHGLILSASGASNLQGFDYVWANIQMRMGPERRAAYERATDPEYAEAHPEQAERERLNALAAAYVFDPSHIPVVAEALGRPGANFPAVRGLVYADLRRIGYDVADELTAYAPPALILSGRQDLVGEAVPLRIHAALPDSELVWFNECSHYPWLDQPEAYFEAIAAFLAHTPS
jgi:proline iminopeptidase